MIHKIPVSEILENRLVVRLGIVEFVVDDALLRPGAIQARRHRVVRRGGVTRSITEIVIAAVLVHPRGLEKVLNLDIFGSAREFEHVLLEFHATTRTPRTPIHPDIIAIVENRGVDIQFHVVLRFVSHQRMPERVRPRSRRMVRHRDANRKALAPIFLDRRMMHCHVPVELTVTIFAMPRKRARVRPLESLDAQHSTVIVIVFHVVGHHHVPIVHHERLVVIALWTLLVVAGEDKEAVVVHEGGRVGRIERSSKGVGGECRDCTKDDTYKVFEHNKTFFVLSCPPEPVLSDSRRMRAPPFFREEIPAYAGMTE